MRHEEKVEVHYTCDKCKCRMGTIPEYQLETYPSLRYVENDQLRRDYYTAYKQMSITDEHMIRLGDFKHDFCTNCALKAAKLIKAWVA
jgi:hypothetical protein